MKKTNKFWLYLLAGVLGVCTLEAGRELGVPGVDGVIAPAEAIVGRPLTPVSVAGVARRTVRRCAVGVYVC